MFSRRDVVKLMAALGSVVLAPLDRFGRSGGDPIAHAQEPMVGELYEGFLLLPAGAPTPSIVRMPEPGVPIFCGVGAGRGGPEPTAVIEQLPTLADLANRVSFPIYTFHGLSQAQEATNLQLLSHETGEIYAASITFRASMMNQAAQHRSIGLWIEPEFPRPFPIWDTNAEWDTNPRAEKVNFLPAPGLMKTTVGGYTFYWINHDTLYMLCTNGLSASEATDLSHSLSVLQ